ncbi:MAG: hypothetical protein KDK99_13140 [Verrucomicrobiales bacterium]|nr:hypothetical protein [Verrucomicrobiales bacterium]
MSDTRYCEACGAAVEAGLRFCPECGQPLREPEEPAKKTAPADSSSRASTASAAAIEWDHEMRLVQNPFMIYDMIKVWGIGSMAPLLLLAGLSFWEGSYRGLAAAGFISFWIFLGFLILSALIMLVIFRNRYPIHYCVDRKGIGMESRSTTASKVSTLAILAGLLGGGSRGMTTAGAGFLAKAGENAHLPWRELNGAHYYPERNAISLMNDWRVVVRLEMPAEIYPQMEERVRAAIAKNETKHGPPKMRETPAPLRAILTLLAILFGWALLGDEKPLVIPPAVVLAVVAMTIVALWSNRGLSKALGALALIGGAAVAIYAYAQGEFENRWKEYWGLALFAELVLWGFFLGVGGFILAGKLRTQPLTPELEGSNS